MDVDARAADLPDQTRMSFWEHVEELRQRMKIVFVVDTALWVLFMTCGLATVSIGGTKVAVPFPVFGTAQAPLSGLVFVLLVHLLVPPWVTLAGQAPWSGVVVEAEVSLFLTAIVGAPLGTYEFARFLGPALKPSEKQVIMRLMIPALALFFAGMALDLLVILPFTISFLYSIQRTLGATLYLFYMDSFVTFVVIHVIAFGVAFELPLIMYALTAVGVVRAVTWRKHWRVIVAAIWIISGMITPDPSGVTMIIVAFILTGLYALGVVSAGHAERVRGPKAALVNTA